MDLRHLRYFVQVAEDLHFARAAAHLGISQPPLSQQIRRLEQEIGAVLFDRRTRPICLTAAGEIFLEEAKRALEHVRRGVEVSRHAGRGQVGWLSVGAIIWAQAAIVPALVRRLRAEAPDVRLALSTSAPTEQMDALLQERLDVAFAAFAPWLMARSALQVEPLIEERMVALVAHDHPLAKRAQVSLDELATYPFLTLSQEVTPGLTNQQITAMHDRGLTLRQVQEVHHPQTLLSLIAAGVGVSLHMASYRNLRRDVAFVPLEDEAPTAKLFMVWRREDERPLVHVLLDVARAVARSTTFTSSPASTRGRRRGRESGAL
jgi:DNA-binding transcriptional LysR family regulator